jgi:Macrocin-O-methyltransferase (TylF)
MWSVARRGLHPDARGSGSLWAWLADSFAGLPRPDTAKYKADKGMRPDLAAAMLVVPEAEVGAHFQRYGLPETGSALLLAGSMTRCTMP